MIQYIVGNLLDSPAQALVNTVNTVGIMGKGIALQFKQRFPDNYKVYQKACKDGSLKVGELLLVKDKSLLSGEKWIINFPTKTDWRKPSEYTYVETGLKSLRNLLIEKDIQSVALPPLGAGNGGLEWPKVKQLIEQYMADMACDIIVYEPNNAVKEILRKERVALTPARAMLLSVLYDLIGQGEFASEFASEKICYFLQRFGAEDIFKLSFNRSFYGPYSGKVKHVLHYLNGSYISGYGSKDKKPFEAISIITDAAPDVKHYLSTTEFAREKAIVEKTKAFLSGFYDDFGLELLSTLDYIIKEKNTADLDSIRHELKDWSDRKKKMFAQDRYLQIGIQKIQAAQML